MEDKLCKEYKELEFTKLEFEKSLELRNLEIGNFWKRGWFFGALLLTLVTGYFHLKSEAETQKYCIYVAFLAFLVSLAQSLMNRGSKYWQERWEYKTKNRESHLGIDVTKTENYNNNERYYIDASIRAKGENIFMRATRFSVSKIAILVWDTITISCVLLWLNELLPFQIDDTFKIWFFHGVIIFYIAIFIGIDGKYNFVENLLKCKGEKHPQDNKDSEKYKKDCENYVKDNINPCGL